MNAFGAKCVTLKAQVAGEERKALVHYSSEDSANCIRKREETALLELASGPERTAAKRALQEEAAKLRRAQAPERARRKKLRLAEWRRRRQLGDPFIQVTLTLTLTLTLTSPSRSPYFLTLSHPYQDHVHVPYVYVNVPYVSVCLTYVHGLIAQPWEDYLDGEYDENGIAWDWDERTAIEAFQKGLIVPCVLNPHTRVAAGGETEYSVRWCLGDPGRDTWHSASELEGTEALQRWRAEPGRVPTREECMGRAPWTERVRELRAVTQRELEARWRARYDYLY